MHPQIRARASTSLFEAPIAVTGAGLGVEAEGVSYPMKRSLIAYVVLCLILSVGCSDEGVAPVPEVPAPSVRILYPADLSPQVWVVSDSIDVYIGAVSDEAHNPEAQIEHVSVWFRHPASVQNRFVGSVGQPIDPASVEDEEILEYIERLPSGWSLYTRRWYTGPRYPESQGGTPINSGTEVQLFATAQNIAEGVSVTDPVRIRVFNMGEDLRAPVPNFSITPREGTVETVFEFDPTATTDEISPIDEIQTRWDFTGDGNWEIDWVDLATAADIQPYKYAVPGRYVVVLQVRNTYLPDSLRSVQREHVVTPIGGEPRPPHDDYVRIPPLTYTRGDTSFVVDGVEHRADALESPIHQVRLRSEYLIERTEVTNQRYLEYLEAALGDTGEPTIRFIHDRIVSAETGVTHLIFNDSRIFFDLDIDGFRIQEGFADHPVTGVSWYGANAYAVFYGLRLPTEAEWEGAARGTNRDLNFPYVGGEEFITAEARHRINYRDSGDPFDNRTTPAGFYDGRVANGFQTTDSPSVYGVYDMAGNVAEWTSDWFGAYPSGTVTDPQGPLIGHFKIVRGGSFLSSRFAVRLTRRSGAFPDQTFPTIGFRTAYVEFY